MTILEYYKDIKENSNFKTWEIASAFIVFNSIDYFIENPTEEEYMTIYDICYRAYMKGEDVNLVQIADKISEMYSEKEFTLEELVSKSAWEILDLAEC